MGSEFDLLRCVATATLCGMLLHTDGARCSEGKEPKEEDKEACITKEAGWTSRCVRE